MSQPRCHARGLYLFFLRRRLSPVSLPAYLSAPSLPPFQHPLAAMSASSCSVRQCESMSSRRRRRGACLPIPRARHSPASPRLNERVSSSWVSDVCAGAIGPTRSRLPLVLSSSMHACVLATPCSMPGNSSACCCGSLLLACLAGSPTAAHSPWHAPFSPPFSACSLFSAWQVALVGSIAL
jgi:hypothetical protein